MIKFQGMKSPKIVILYGFPGAGKDTQAEILEESLDFSQISSSKLIEEKIFNPELQNDPVIKKERELYEKGVLCTPEWVTKIINDKVAEMHAEKRSPVFSGSPRTLYEAENEIPYWESIYQKEKIFIFLIKISEDTSIFRNTHRRVCSICRHPIIYSEENKSITICPMCGGVLKKRLLDTEELMQTRVKEYKERTEPIFVYLKNKGYKIFEIDGEVSPNEVAKQIIKNIPNGEIEE
jgi:adenylate kinase